MSRVKSACYLCHDISVAGNGKIIFRGFKRPLHEAIPDIFYYDFVTDFEMAVWNEHAAQIMESNNNGGYRKTHKDHI